MVDFPANHVSFRGANTQHTECLGDDVSPPSFEERIKAIHCSKVNFCQRACPGHNRSPPNSVFTLFVSLFRRPRCFVVAFYLSGYRVWIGMEK